MLLSPLSMNFDSFFIYVLSTFCSSFSLCSFYLGLQYNVVTLGNKKCFNVKLECLGLRIVKTKNLIIIVLLTKMLCKTSAKGRNSETLVSNQSHFQPILRLWWAAIKEYCFLFGLRVVFWWESGVIVLLQVKGFRRILFFSEH